MIAWFARNGVAANFLALGILCGGFASLASLKIELFPNFSLDRINVSVVFRSAAPQEVEEQIIERLEEAVEGLEGIEKITSIASEGVGNLSLEVARGYSVRKMLEDVRSRVDRIIGLPQEAERPVVEEIVLERQVLSIAIYGPQDEEVLKSLADEVRDDLLDLPHISEVRFSGVRNREISIQVNPLALERYNLSFEDVARAVRANSLDLPGGKIETRGGEILVRSKSQAYTARDFEAIVVIAQANASHVLIKDVAEVVDGFEDLTLVAQFNGQSSVGLDVFEIGNENPLEISKAVHAYIEEKGQQLAGVVKLTVWQDITFYLWGRLQLLMKNGLIGLLLVFGILALFLRPSLAAFVAFGIPVSFFGALALMPYFDVSLNLISIFGFIMVLGIVVDDAIVVGEQVFTEIKKNGRGVESAIRGTHAVAVPVTFAVLTTVVVFLPLLDLPGFEGKFMRPMAMVVILALLFSLLQSKLVLPYHLSLCGFGKRRGRLMQIQGLCSQGLETFVDQVYLPCLKQVLKWPLLFIASMVALLLITFSMLQGGLIKTVPFPNVPSDYIQVLLRYGEGVDVSLTQSGLKRSEAALQEIIEEAEAAGRGNPVSHYSTLLGQQTFNQGPSGLGSSSVKSNLAQMSVELSKSASRHAEDSALILSRKWREKLGKLPGISSLRFIASAGGSGGAPVDIEIAADNLNHLRALAKSLKKELSNYEGLYGIRDDLPDLKEEIQIKTKHVADFLGLSQESLAREVRGAFSGIEVQRLQREGEQLRVFVRYSPAHRSQLASLEKMRVSLPGGGQVPLLEVATLNRGLAPASIRRQDGRRTAHLYARADKDLIDLEAVKADLVGKIFPKLNKQYPAARLEMGGESKDAASTNQRLKITLSLALLVIYALLAIPFKSYIQPLIIMSVIPFALIGALWGHFLLGHSLSRLSIFGIIALAGILVNDSLVLVDFINRQRRAGTPLQDALQQAATRRFRPVLLTSLTTFFGLLPLLFEKSLQAQFLIPMAISLSFGVLFATAITLFLVPCVYCVIQDTQRLLKHFYTKWRA